MQTNREPPKESAFLETSKRIFQPNFEEFKIDLRTFQSALKKTMVSKEAAKVRNLCNELGVDEGSWIGPDISLVFFQTKFFVFVDFFDNIHSNIFMDSFTLYSNIIPTSSDL